METPNNDAGIESLIQDQFKDDDLSTAGDPRVLDEVDFEPEDDVEEEKKPEAEEPKEEEIEEDPKAEEPVGDSSLNDTDSEEETGSETKEEKTEEPTFSMDDQIAKRTDGKFESFEDMEDALEEAQEKLAKHKEHEYGNELIQKLDELAKSGKNIDMNFVQSYLVDYSVYDIENTNHALELVRMGLKLNEPDITDRELKYELSQYKLDPDSYDEEEVEMSQAKLMRQARKFKRELNEAKAKMDLPLDGGKRTNEPDPEVVRQQQEQAEQAQKEFKRSVRKEVKDYKTHDYKIGDEDFSYSLSDDDSKVLAEDMNNTDKFFQEFINKDGSVNFGELKKMLFIKRNHDKIVQAAVAQAKSAGKKEVAKDIKNSNLDSKAARTEPSGGGDAIENALFKHFKAK